MRIVSVKNTQRLDIAFRKSGMIILGFSGPDADKHRGLIWQISEIIYRDKNKNTRYQEADKLIDDAIQSVHEFGDKNPDFQTLMFCRLFDLHVLGVENNWEHCSLLKSLGVEQDEKKVSADLKSNSTELKKLYSEIEITTSLLPEEFAAEKNLLLCIAKLITDWTLFNAHLNFNLHNKEYVACDNKSSFLSHASLQQQREHLFDLLSKCHVQQFMAIHTKSVEMTRFNDYFSQKIQLFSNGFLYVRPLQDVWETPNGQVVFAERQVLKYYVDLYSEPVDGKSAGKNQIKKQYKDLITALQACVELPETAPQEKLIKFDWLRLMFHLKNNLHCILESDLESCTLELSEKIKKEIEHLHFESIRLLQSYVDTSAKESIVAQLAELVKLQMDTLEIAIRLRFGSVMSFWSVLNINALTAKIEDTKARLQAEAKLCENFSVYVHPWYEGGLTTKTIVNPTYADNANKIAERYLPIMRSMLNAVILAEENQAIALLLKKMLLLQRNGGTVLEAKKVFDQIDGFVKNSLKSKKMSNLAKAEARYFYFRAMIIYQGLAMIRQSVMPSKSTMQVLLKELEVGLTVLRSIPFAELSNQEQQLMTLYQVELACFRVNCMVDLGMEGIEKSYQEAVQQFYQLGHSQPLASISEPELFREQLSTVQLDTSVMLLISNHHSHTREIILLPLFNVLTAHLDKVNALNFSQREIEAARKLAQQDWQSHLGSKDILASLFAHVLYFEKTGSVNAATQFLYALEQVTANQKVDSYLEKATDALFPLQLSAFERERHHYFWKHTPPAKPHWVVTDNSSPKAIVNRLEAIKTTYCGCKECDNKMAFQFKDEKKAQEVLGLAQLNRFG